LLLAHAARRLQTEQQVGAKSRRLLAEQFCPGPGERQAERAALRNLDARSRAAGIQAATNKSESFNDFVKWLAFGGGGVIAENDRGEQRKIIKYNHLLANCLVFHNVCMMTSALHKLGAEGVPVEPDAVAALSPYIRSHISRFGQYTLDLSRTPAPLDYDLPILTSSGAVEPAAAADD
jgi:hypothetical protein